MLYWRSRVYHINFIILINMLYVRLDRNLIYLTLIIINDLCDDVWHQTIFIKWGSCDMKYVREKKFDVNGVKSRSIRVKSVSHTFNKSKHWPPFLTPLTFSLGKEHEVSMCLPIGWFVSCVVMPIIGYCCEIYSLLLVT